MGHSLQKRGRIRSRIAGLRERLRKHLLQSEVDSYDVEMRPPRIVDVRFRIKEAAATRDLSQILSPLTYGYSSLDSTYFAMEKIDGYGEEEDEESSTISVFEGLKPQEVEGRVLRDLYPSRRRMGLLNFLGLARSRVEKLTPLHLALSSLHPQSFDFERIISLPPGKALMPFQMEGVRFLIERGNALLADEMGLGKSIQTIVAVKLLFQAGAAEKCLIACPKSVLTDWAYKLEEWAPELAVSRISGPVSTRRNLWLQKSQIYLVTYDTLKEDVLSHDEEDGLPPSFDLVILDEVQRIKNRSTKTFKAVNRVHGRMRWGLSGTPLENRVEELTAIFSYLKPGLLSPYEDSPQHVKSAIRPFTLRRTKKAVLRDLPKKIHDKVFLELGPRQRAAYNLAEETGVTALRERGGSATVTHVMALISKLKQICNIESESGESCKLDYVEDVLENLSETGEKVVVFSQYPEKTLKLLMPRLSRFNPLMYQGSLTDRQREEVLRRFEEDDESRLLLMSLKAGGLGLTLTAANYVIHFDSWWNPAAMSQAEDRTHRIGQMKNVFVASLITRGTVEERIQRILEEKRALFKEVVGEISDEGLSQLLSEKELFGLFGIQRAKDKQLILRGL